MSILVLAVVVCVLQAPLTLCLPSGAPAPICCNTMTPLHGVDPLDPLEVPSNFTFAIEKDAATNRFTVSIVKTEATGPPFRGFLVQARDQTTNATVGTFVDPVDGSKTINCFGAANSITHSDNRDRESVQLNWVPPPGPLDGIRFVLTPVQTAAVFWTDVRSDDLGDF